MPVIRIPNLPGNSNNRPDPPRQESREPEEGEQQPKNKKVVKTPVRKKKLSFFEKIGRVLFDDDTDSVGSYILYDVLIPAAKSTISEMVSSGIEMLLYGGDARRDTISRRDRDRTYVSYNTIGRSSSRERERRDRPEPVRTRKSDKYEGVVIATRGEAEDVLANLTDMISDYGVATIADFCDAVGLDSDMSDTRWGWDTLKNASILRVRRGNGYVIDFPRPKEID